MPAASSTASASSAAVINDFVQQVASSDSVKRRLRRSPVGFDDATDDRESFGVVRLNKDSSTSTTGSAQRTSSVGLVDTAEVRYQRRLDSSPAAAAAAEPAPPTAAVFPSDGFRSRSDISPVFVDITDFNRSASDRQRSSAVATLAHPASAVADR
jgi:hypothetical protein